MAAAKKTAAPAAADAVADQPPAMVDALVDVEAVEPIRHDGDYYGPGMPLAVPPEIADLLIAAGAAK